MNATLTRCGARLRAYRITMDSTGWRSDGRRRRCDLTNAIARQHSVERREIARHDVFPGRNHGLEIDTRARITREHTRRRRHVAVVLRIELIHEGAVHADKRRSRRAAAAAEAAPL